MVRLEDETLSISLDNKPASIAQLPVPYLNMSPTEPQLAVQVIDTRVERSAKSSTRKILILCSRLGDIVPLFIRGSMELDLWMSIKCGAVHSRGLSGCSSTDGID